MPEKQLGEKKISLFLNGQCVFPASSSKISVPTAQRAGEMQGPREDQGQIHGLNPIGLAFAISR